MCNTAKETQCTHCVHRNVCKHKADFLDIVSAVDEATVHKSEDDNRVLMKKITNYDCFGEVIVTCRYYQKEATQTRDGIF